MRRAATKIRSRAVKGEGHEGAGDPGQDQDPDRRREQDMPLAQPPENATPTQIAKTEQVRQKMIRLARDRYLFRVQDRRMTTGLIVENRQLAGLKVAETKVEGRRAEPIPGSEHELRAPLVVSSIGSVPEVIPGVAMKGEYYTFTDHDLPRYTGCDRVFGVGNVVTGQGNIRVSLVHSQHVTTQLIENYMGIGNDGESFSALYASAEARAAERAKAVQERVQSLPALSESEIAAIAEVRAALLPRQRALVAGGGIVVAGRDIGTVVLPDADLKVYLDASAEERARRRALERGLDPDGDDAAAILGSLRRRDASDAGRAVAPLRIAADAVVVTTDGNAFPETVAGVVDVGREAGRAAERRSPDREESAR